MNQRLLRRHAASFLLATMLVAAPVAAAPSAPASAPARGLADTALAPASVTAQTAGEAALATRHTQIAIDSFEAALAADPRNVNAYVGIARAAEAEGLPGKAIRFYREALAIDPNNRLVLEAQANAYLSRGAKSRAEANLERLKTLCSGSCPPADRLSAAIQRHDALAKAAPAQASVAVVTPPAAPPQR